MIPFVLENQLYFAWGLSFLPAEVYFIQSVHEGQSDAMRFFMYLTSEQTAEWFLHQLKFEL